ncbi:hypothetical protein AB0O16_08545 [Microbacterium sp. NPDC089180]|uniref:hypothetical protein n=1 Tax=unclassified Microbacterium TaxID=2609290 RepID=UPI00342AFB1D
MRLDADDALPLRQRDDAGLDELADDPHDLVRRSATPSRALRRRVADARDHA